MWHVAGQHHQPLKFTNQTLGNRRTGQRPQKARNPAKGTTSTASKANIKPPNGGLSPII
jgi:hypothetical protein